MTATPAPAPAPARPPNNPRVNVPKSKLQRLLHEVAASGNAQIHAHLADDVVARSVFVTNDPVPEPVSPKEAAPDAALAARVARLQRRAAELAPQMPEERAAGIAALRSNLGAALSRVPAAPPSPAALAGAPHSRPAATLRLANDAAANVPTVPAAIRKAAHMARRNKQRADNLREVLRIVRDNTAPDGSVDQLHGREDVSADLTRLLAESKRLQSDAPDTAGVHGDEDGGLDNSGADGDDEDFGLFGSPIPRHPRAAGLREQECMLSPFITPRSKTRRRLLRGAGLRQPRFDMPR